MNENLKKMLEGLRNKPEDLTELGSLIGEMAVFAEVHVGRCRNTIALPPKAVGVRPDRMTEAARKTYQERVTMGNLRFIPYEDDCELARIEGSVRRSLESFTTANGLMPANAYEQFMEIFESHKTAYMAARDKILANWEENIKTFETNMKIMLDGIRMPQKDRVTLLESIMRSLPSKTRYGNSFYMNTFMRVFPQVPSFSPNWNDSVNDKIMECWTASVEATAEDSIISLLEEAFGAIENAIKAYLRTNRLHGNSINALNRMGSKLKRLNLFHNPMVERVADVLSKCSGDIGKVTETENDLEMCACNIYQYCREVGHPLDLSKSIFDEEMLMPKVA